LQAPWVVLSACCRSRLLLLLLLLLACCCRPHQTQAALQAGRPLLLLYLLLCLLLLQPRCSSLHCPLPPRFHASLHHCWPLLLLLQSPRGPLGVAAESPRQPVPHPALSKQDKWQQTRHCRQQGTTLVWSRLLGLKRQQATAQHSTAHTDLTRPLLLPLLSPPQMTAARAAAMGHAVACNQSSC
jgi:hypothetical protein